MEKSSSLPSSAEYWVPSGRPIEVAGYRIGGGLLYFGTGLTALREWAGPEPALVDPRLPVDRERPDRQGLGMRYWPSYSEIAPSCRSAYLEWLEGGREDPAANIGYVFLFFYGLERRLLRDNVLVGDSIERVAIRTELERLRALYPRSGSFQGYVGRLLGAIDLVTPYSEITSRQPPLPASPAWELPPDVRLALGVFASEGRPLPADWALSWLLHSPETRLRTPAKRCFDEFKELFRIRYREQLGEGLTIKTSKANLVQQYRPASASFGGDLTLAPARALPDVGSQRAPLKRLAAIADVCMDQLDAYSRYLGKMPTGQQTVGAIALLPRELAGRRHAPEGEDLTAFAEASLAESGAAVVDAAHVFDRWPNAEGDRLTKASGVLLAQFLETREIGIEPDVRFGGPALSRDGKAVLFKLSGPPLEAPSSSYRTATLLLHVGATVATADGYVAPEERTQLEAQVASDRRLSPEEQTRLAAHLRWLLDSKPGLTGLKKRLAGLDDASKRALASFLVGVAGADGCITAEELDSLRKIYPLLGLDRDAVFSDVHALAATAAIPSDEPVTVREGRAPKGHPIPAPTAPGSPNSGVELDLAKVRAKLAETAAVAALLGGVFVDDEPPAAAPALEGPFLKGLDPAHSGLLRSLSERSPIARTVLEKLASEQGLLPDGALETINDAAVELHGEAVIEGDDPITVNRSLVEEWIA